MEGSFSHKALKAEDMTHVEIGKVITQTRETIKHHIKILDAIGTEVLDLPKEHREGCVPRKVQMYHSILPKAGLKIRMIDEKLSVKQAANITRLIRHTGELI